LYAISARLSHSVIFFLLFLQFHFSFFFFFFSPDGFGFLFIALVLVLNSIFAPNSVVSFVSINLVVLALSKR